MSDKQAVSRATAISQAFLKARADTLLLVIDLAGVFLFAIEGASAAIGSKLDALGIMVLSFSVALGGGTIRDLLIGASPPNAIRDWRYPAVAFSGGALVMVFRNQIAALPASPLMVLDAAGLALCAVAGTKKALTFNIHPFMAVFMGAITGSGGGVVRDVLLARVPHVLEADIYATAALAGAAVLLLVGKAGAPPWCAALVGGLSCFALRVVSVWLHWNLPH